MMPKDRLLRKNYLTAGYLNLYNQRQTLYIIKISFDEKRSLSNFNVTMIAKFTFYLPEFAY